MKIETFVNAHAATYAYIAAADVWTDESGAVFDPLLYAKRVLQEAAFRARILRTFEQYEIYHGFHMGDVMMIETITEKDARIAELEATVTELLVISAKERIARLEEAQDDDSNNS